MSLVEDLMREMQLIRNTNEEIQKQLQIVSMDVSYIQSHYARFVCVIVVITASTQFAYVTLNFLSDQG